MFLTTDDPVREMEHEFYRSFDPFSHFVTAELLSTGHVGEFGVEFERETEETVKSGTPSEATELLDALNRARERSEDQKHVLTRVLRYFASETLILMILAAPPHGPFFRIASTLRGKALNEVFLALKKREIPKEFRLNLNKMDVDDFEIWLGCKLFKDPEFFREESAKELIELLVEEADLLSERGAINAFKHGRPIVLGQSLAGKITLSDHPDKPSAKIVPVKGLQWVTWAPSQNGFVVSTETEDFDYNYDKKRIFQIALIANSIRTKRLAEIEGRDSVTINLPTIKKLSGQIRRQHHKTSFGGSE